MNHSIYFRLAVTNIKNNRKTYVPFILTSILTVMMTYMLTALLKSDSITDVNVKTCLSMALGVEMFFSVIFLFYTNSFLIKRRKKEIGVYHILGMGKGHLGKMMTVETLLIAAVSIAGGVVGGIVFGKLMYLLLLKMIHYDVGMEFGISTVAVMQTLGLFFMIFLCTLVYNLFQIKLANPVDLLHGSSVGEKEPKTKWLLTIIGIATIGVGYYLALVTDKPLQALTNFFVAVILVMIGTYALFVAGSIALLKFLRKRKRFYYKSSHFTAVSGMIYRMKQNAVGLANICILSTAVLVMVAISVCLYVGMEDILKYRFPKDYAVYVMPGEEGAIQTAQTIVSEETKKAGIQVEKEWDYYCASVAATKHGSDFSTEEPENLYNKEVVEITLLPLEEYEKLEGEKLSLQPDELLVYTPDGTYQRNSVTLDGRKFRVVKELETFSLEEKNKSSVVPSYYMILPDKKTVEEMAGGPCGYIMRFDAKGTEQAKQEAGEQLTRRIADEAGGIVESREASKSSFYSLYGSLLFIGLYLGIMFLMATVLIIYYKQISEGFDDKERYQIMQKVGMDKREVKRSIRSQVLMVFFLPLLVAVIHVSVAFPVMTKLLVTLNMVNVPLFLMCTVVTVLVFVVFYVLVFAITAREYYKIVN